MRILPGLLFIKITMAQMDNVLEGTMLDTGISKEMLEVGFREMGVGPNTKAWICDMLKS